MKFHLVLLFLSSLLPLFSANTSTEEGKTLSPVSTNPTTQKAKVWTAKTGESLVARFITLNQNDVILEKMDGNLKKISLEQLIEEDARLARPQIDSPEKTEQKSITFNNKPFPINMVHPVQAVMDFVKQGELSAKEGIQFYNFVAEKFKKFFPSYTLPKDILNEEIARKYQLPINLEKKPISERLNLFTGKPLRTQMIPGEPLWTTVSQSRGFVQVNKDYQFFYQLDILHAGSQEKYCLTRFQIKGTKDQRSIEEFRYSEFTDKYLWYVGFNPQETEEYPASILFNEKSIRNDLIFAVNQEKNAFYTFLTLDFNGQIINNNYEKIAIGFFACKEKFTKEQFLGEGLRTFILNFVNYFQNAYNKDGDKIFCFYDWATNNTRKPPPELRDNPFNLFQEKMTPDEYKEKAELLIRWNPKNQPLKETIFNVPLKKSHLVRGLLLQWHWGTDGANIDTVEVEVDGKIIYELKKQVTPIFLGRAMFTRMFRFNLPPGTKAEKSFNIKVNGHSSEKGDFHANAFLILEE